MREKRTIEIRVRCDIDLQKKNDKNFDFFTITTSQWYIESFLQFFITK